MLFSQLQTPAEAIHFAEYGILGFLFFQAWRQPVRDPLVYPISALSLTLVAWLDEFLQWLTPGRFWDYRDIRLNLLAGVIVLSLIALVIRPAEVRGPVARRSVRRLCFLAWALFWRWELPSPTRRTGSIATQPGFRFSAISTTTKA